MLLDNYNLKCNKTPQALFWHVPQQQSRGCFCQDNQSRQQNELLGNLNHQNNSS